MIWIIRKMSFPYWIIQIMIFLHVKNAKNLYYWFKNWYSWRNNYEIYLLEAKLFGENGPKNDTNNKSFMNEFEKEFIENNIENSLRCLKHKENFDFYCNKCEIFVKNVIIIMDIL